jgi:hypothetical protein
VVDLIRNEVQNVKRNAWKNCVQHVIEVENYYVSPNTKDFIIILVTLDTDSELDSKSEEDDL